MKSSLILVAITLSVPLLVAQNERGQADKNFALGEVVGHCLVVKCQVFRGTLLTDSLKPGEPAMVRVEEWLFGPPSPGPNGCRAIR